MTNRGRCAAIVHLALAVALTAQQDRLQAVARTAIADLATPERVADACRRLENLGPRVVPLLRQMLHFSHREETTTAVKQQLLYVLGRLGRAALPALPEVREILRGSDESLALQSTWTLGMMAPFFTVDVADAVRADVYAAPASVRRDAQAGILCAQLTLPTVQGPEQLRRLLLREDNALVAECRWLAAHAQDELQDRDQLSRMIATRLDNALQRQPIQFSKGAQFGGVALAEALLALTGSPLSATTARALLEHWHPDQRRRAVLWMADNGAALPVLERTDLVARLWDPDASIVRSTGEAFAGWGAAGLVALIPLRHFADAHPDAATAAACGRAADAVVAACSTLPADDAAFVRAVDAALRRQPALALPARPSRSGMALASTMLRMAQWHDATVLATVLDRFEAGGPDEQAVQNVYGWLTTDDAAVTMVALAWLARHPALTRSAIGVRLDDSLAGECVRLARYWVAAPARRCAIEATAWLQTAGMSTEDLRAQLDSENTRLLARALAALLSKPLEATAGADEALHRLVAIPARPLLLCFGDRFLHDDGCPQEVDLSAPVRTLAALALASHRQPVADADGLGQLIERYCGCSLDQLPQWLAQQRANGKLAAVIDAIEADCRARLGVDEALRWPRVEQAR